ncbi:MAG: DUF5693 family protein [Oscillospiraceae bacterium]
MKEYLRPYRLLLLLVAICTFAAFWLLGERIHTERGQKQIDIVMTYEDIVRLADASEMSVQTWMSTLSKAGVRELLVTEAEQNDPAVVQDACAGVLELAQVGGLAQGGMYFFAAQYDTTAEPGIRSGIGYDEETLPQAQVLSSLQRSGSTLVLVENPKQTGCILPDGYSLEGYTGNMAKCFWLNMTFRSRYQTLGYSCAEEIVNMCYRAVVDRGMTVLWLAPLTDVSGEMVADPAVYTQLLQALATRIAPAGYQYGAASGIAASEVSPVLLIDCGVGVFAAAIVLLGTLVPLRRRWLRGLLLALGCLESAAGTLLAPELQCTALALLASIVFPCLSVTVLSGILRQTPVGQKPTVKRYLAAVALCTAVTLWGCCYIGAILSGSEYLLVLKLFRGVKLSQLTVYAFAILLLAFVLLHVPGNRLRADVQQFRRENSRNWTRKVVCVLAILAIVGIVYILRTGDGMLSTSVAEQRVRNWLERVLLYRPRTKEFLIAYPAIAVAYCCAAHRSRLLTWLFGVFGAIGFASVANTFCHIRAHFLVSLCRTGIGLVIGLALGSVILLILRVIWPVHVSDAPSSSPPASKE